MERAMIILVVRMAILLVVWAVGFIGTLRFLLKQQARERRANAQQPSDAERDPRGLP
jgi:beta-lactamase regulating signal transducer with metallopeptidase domain